MGKKQELSNIFHRLKGEFSNSNISVGRNKDSKGDLTSVKVYGELYNVNINYDRPLFKITGETKSGEVDEEFNSLNRAVEFVKDEMRLK